MVCCTSLPPRISPCQDIVYRQVLGASLAHLGVILESALLYSGDTDVRSCLRQRTKLPQPQTSSHRSCRASGLEPTTASPKYSIV